MSVPRVSPSEHDAFMAEIKDLRRRANKLRQRLGLSAMFSAR
jgi:hypothetical protein